MKSLLLAILVVAGLLFGPASQAHTLIVGLPPTMEDATRVEITKAVRQIYASDQPGDSVLFFDAVSFRRIALAELPNDPALRDDDLRREKLNPAFRPVWAFLKADQPSLMPGGHVDLPSLLIEASNNAIPADGNAAILVLGSALYADPREPTLSEHNGLFPGDGHLSLTHRDSPYGTKDLANLMRGGTVTLCYTDQQQAFVSEAYRSAVGRYWALFVAAMGGKWGAFEPLSANCVQRGIAGTPAVSTPTPDPTDIRPVMRTIERSGPPEVVAAAVPATVVAPSAPVTPQPSPQPVASVQTATTPTPLSVQTQPPTPVVAAASPPSFVKPQQGTPVPSVTALNRQMASSELFANPICQGPPPNPISAARIGIKWGPNPVDLDLYARAGNGPWLFFDHPYPEAGGNGRFEIDWKRPPEGMDAYEAVEYPHPIDLNALQVHVNIYEGESPGGVPFIVRIWPKGMSCTYEASYRISASSGNGGQGDHRGPHWAVIDVPQMLKLPLRQTAHR